MNADIVIVDLQGFKDYQNQFILKEFAILINGYSQIFLVKPPYAFTKLTKEERKRVQWLENDRGIYWSEGFIDYREFKQVIKPYLNKKKILVKGLEKIKWIKNFHENCEIIDMGENGCPNFAKLCDEYEKSKNLNLNCVYHKNKCALKNVICLEKWCKDNNFDAFLPNLFNSLTISNV